MNRIGRVEDAGHCSCILSDMPLLKQLITGERERERERERFEAIPNADLNPASDYDESLRK